MAIMDIYKAYESNLSMMLNVYSKYYTEWLEGSMTRPHSHKWCEIMYVEAGSCKIVVNDDIRSLRCGEYMFISAQTPHLLLIDRHTSCKMLNVEFGFDYSGLGFIDFAALTKRHKTLETFVHNKAEYLVIKDCDDVKEVLKHIIVECDQPNKEACCMVEAMLIQLIMHVANQSSRQTNDQNYQASYVRQAIDFIHEHYNEDINVTTVAEHVGVHSSYLQRLLRKKINMTVNDVIITTRINSAKKMLVKTELPILDLAMHVGFNSRQYFTYVFKNSTGLTPAAYRRHNTICESVLH